MVVRKDKQKNIVKITKSVLTNPLQTERELAKEVWVSNWTAHNILKQVEQSWAKDPRILWICDTDLEIVTLGQNEIKKRLINTPSKIGVRDIVSAMESWTKRYTIFRGDLTDKDGAFKQELTEEQIEKIISKYKLNG
jgi:hypothetical protein